MNNEKSFWQRGSLSLLILVVLGSVAAVPAQAFTVTISTSLPSPQPVGTPVTVQATVADAGGAEILYRFAAMSPGSSKNTFIDFNTTSEFSWRSLDTGTYGLQVTATDPVTGETKIATQPYVLASRVTGTAPVVSATDHPLVALMSAPACPVGSASVVIYKAAADTKWSFTPFVSCRAGQSINHYVAGMRPETSYSLVAVVVTGGTPSVVGALPFLTAAAPDAPVDFTTTDPTLPGTSVNDGVLMTGYLTPRLVSAADLNGNLIWYAKEGGLLTRPLNGGKFLFLRNPAGESSIVREEDLVGHISRETNVRRVNEQLAVMGMDPITFFHHDAIRLPNGHTIVMSYVERILVDVQGAGPVNVLGDYLVDLDQNFQVAWAWNGFDHLDASEQAVLGEICLPGSGGCPPEILLDTQANDWTHMNSIAYSPVDGNLVLSARHLDASFKVDYANGGGSGAVVWRLGEGGSFALDADPGEAWPWFTHQHDTHYDGPTFVVYDNGNTRRDQLGDLENSRGQVYALDEVNLVATLVGNIDLGVYSPALGAAERLRNGNFSFLSGAFAGFSSHMSSEVSVDGTMRWSETGPDAAYRSFRMQSLYTP